MNQQSLINARSILVAAIAIAATLFLFACAGKNFGDFVKVGTPVAIQQAEGIPAKLTLNESEYEYGTWFDGVQRDGAEWRGRIEGGRDSVALLNSLKMQAGEAAMASPALIAVPGLSLILGYLIKRKSDATPTEVANKEKASYNKGRRDTLTALDERAKTTLASDSAATDLIALIKGEIAKA